MEEKKRFYNILKVITTILVVFAHSSRMYTGKGVVIPANSSEVLSFLTEWVYSFHMPLFISISGMVYGYCVEDKGKYRNTLKFLSSKMKRLIIPYFVFGIAYVAPCMVLFKFTSESYFRYCWNGILLATDARHLWYLVVLFEIFVLCAAGQNVLNRIGSLNKYFSLFFICIALLLSVCANEVSSIFQFSSLCYYLVYFYCGILCNRYYSKINNFAKNKLIMAVALLVTLWLINDNAWGAAFAKAISGGLLFIGISAHFRTDCKHYNMIKELCQNGYGVYLFHPVLIYILYIMVPLSRPLLKK
ncbi:MAG: acyltransferase [bacterium]|nr:acyltransferase [bacterium]